MSLPVCPIQEVCPEFKLSDNKPPNHDVRDKYACNHWLAMDCEKMDILIELTQWATGKVFACNLEKIKRIKGELK